MTFIGAKIFKYPVFKEFLIHKEISHWINQACLWCWSSHTTELRFFSVFFFFLIVKNLGFMLKKKWHRHVRTQALKEWLWEHTLGVGKLTTVVHSKLVLISFYKKEIKLFLLVVVDLFTHQLILSWAKGVENFSILHLVSLSSFS